MMSFRALLIIIALLSASTSFAQPHGGNRGFGSNERDKATSQKSATINFWRYSNCVVRSKTEKVNTLISKTDWTEEDTKSAQSLAQNRSGCLTAVFSEMKFDLQLWRDTMSGAMLVLRYKESVLPDYSAVPLMFSEAGLDKTQTEQRTRYLLLAFAECTFRNRSTEVMTFLKTRPFGEAANSAISKLSPVFGHCLPMNEGKQLSFTRAQLRSLLGRSAFLVDKAYYNMESSS